MTFRNLDLHTHFFRFIICVYTEMTLKEREAAKTGSGKKREPWKQTSPVTWSLIIKKEDIAHQAHQTHLHSFYGPQNGSSSSQDISFSRGKHWDDSKWMKMLISDNNSISREGYHPVIGKMAGICDVHFVFFRVWSLVSQSCFFHLFLGCVITPHLALKGDVHVIWIARVRSISNDLRGIWSVYFFFYSEQDHFSHEWKSAQFVWKCT